MNRLSFSLWNAEGERVPCTELELDLGEEHKMGTFQSYNDLVEYVIIPPQGADQSELTVRMETMTYDWLIDGDWATTFRLEKASESLVIPCGRDMKPWTLHEVQLSPISVTAFGTGEMTADSESATLQVILADGTEVPTSSASVSSGDGSVVYRSIFDQVVDLEKVAKVILNGEELPLP